MNFNVGERLERVIISPTESISEAIARLDKAGTGALVLCESDLKVCGLLTDGDVRRAILRGRPVTERCSTIANPSPIVCTLPCSAAQALDLMNQNDIHHLPVVNAEGILQNFVLRKDLVAQPDVEAAAKQRLESVLISPGTSIHDAIAQLDKAGTGALVLCAPGRKITGLLTDGDIRRAILRGIPVERPCDEIATRKPLTADCSTSSAEALRLMNQHDINHLPLVDGEGNVVEFLLRRDFSSEGRQNLAAVIMAGGFGRRLGPLTEKTPKPMLPVGDRPLLERTIHQLRRSGIRDVSLTTHYLRDNIEQHFGRGEAFGVNLNYVREDHPLGTAGGLKLLKQIEGPLLVINGDILTGVSFQDMLVYHRQHHAEMTVGVRKYEVSVPFGVVECNDVRVTNLKEKPSLAFFVNAGVYLLEPSVCRYIPEGQRFDMTDLIQCLLDAGRPVVSFPILEYWLDVGRPADYTRAQEDVRNGRI